MSIQSQSLFSTVKSAHFTGIKGVGMTAAALCLQDLSIRVTGSDLKDDYVTQMVLKQRQIPISIGFSASNIPANTDLLVYTAAHGGLQNPEVVVAKQKGIKAISQAECVGSLMQSKIGISVCGVGGKTSTTAMLATILDYAGLKPSFCIGVGNILNLQVPGRMARGEHFVAEADEYAVSPGLDNTARYMYQSPQIIISTNISHDHPDIYKDLNETKTAFKQFFSKIPSDGTLILNGSNGPTRQIDIGSLPVIWYGVTPANNDWWLSAAYVGEGKQMVQIQSRANQTISFTLSVPGKFNALNALAAYIAAKRLGLSDQEITQALQLFRGSMRRFEKVGERGSIMLYDDYAHHPSQIFATLQAARQWLPLYKIVAVFQPHTFSRTKALLSQFAKCFTYADQVIITDIYASAREAEDLSISGYQLAENVKKFHQDVTYVPKTDLVSYLKKTLKARDAVFTLGAGDIYLIHEHLMS